MDRLNRTSNLQTFRYLCSFLVSKMNLQWVTKKIPSCVKLGKKRRCLLPWMRVLGAITAMAVSITCHPPTMPIITQQHPVQPRTKRGGIRIASEGNVEKFVSILDDQLLLSSFLFEFVSYCMENIVTRLEVELKLHYMALCIIQ